MDHNQHKLLTLNKAREENIAHGKLPIDTYLNMKTRQVLAVNHVFQILLAISSDKKSWKDALLETLPERKNAAAKNTGSEDAESCGEEEFEIETGGEKSGNEGESCDRSEHEKKVQDSTCEKKLLECDNKT